MKRKVYPYIALDEEFDPTYVGGYNKKDARNIAEKFLNWRGDTLHPKIIRARENNDMGYENIPKNLKRGYFEV